jgi:hypothetical protein
MNGAEGGLVMGWELNIENERVRRLFQEYYQPLWKLANVVMDHALQAGAERVEIRPGAQRMLVGGEWQDLEPIPRHVVAPLCAMLILLPAGEEGLVLTQGGEERRLRVEVEEVAVSVACEGGQGH